jgi:ankyrin repeat protein
MLLQPKQYPGTSSIAEELNYGNLLKERFNTPSTPSIDTQIYMNIRNYDNLATIINPTNVDTKLTDIDDTALILASNTTGIDIRIIELLLRNGANINAQNKYGDTPLIRAASSSNKVVVELLLSKGANKDIQNSKNETASSKALIKSQDKSLDLTSGQRNILEDISTFISNYNSLPPQNPPSPPSIKPSIFSRFFKMGKGGKKTKKQTKKRSKKQSKKSRKHHRK